MTTKVHLILNSHLDPIWLWSWRDGLDEVLNTCHYICNLLDRNPDIIYTRGEAWVYEQVQRIDPPLFDRIKAHIEAGRWSMVGGWYIQPDCNLPSGFAFARQIALGQKMFRDYFGRAPAIGYNVDSFGHAATLPGYMHQAGQTGYVMMRPQEHELALPARLFRWRGYADGPVIPTFRITYAYCTPAGLDDEHILAQARNLPEGIHHTMCFVGIGDHGGGPTQEMIDWCRANKHRFPGLELEFSSPERFFAAIAPDMEKLPLVTGELQMHAIGCYTVHRPVKTLVRKAEHKLVQAETALQKFTPVESSEFAEDLLKAWKQVLFHHFHDTLGGTCLPSAFEDVHAQLGQALAVGDEIGAICLRRHLVTLPGDTAQRLVLFNASDLTFNDNIELEPWLEWSPWQPSWQLRDEKDHIIPYQILDPESQADKMARLFFALKLAPRELKILRIVDGGVLNDPTASNGTISIKIGENERFNLNGTGSLVLSAIGNLPLPFLTLDDEPTDTWSHGLDRFPAKNRQTARWQEARALDQGPLMQSFIQDGEIGRSRVRAEWRMFRDLPFVECLLRVNWQEEKKVLRWNVTAPTEIVSREDGILGGSLRRASDGRELPLRDWTRLSLTGATGKSAHLAIVAPDVFSLSGDAQTVSLTLLRSPYMAWHDPHPGGHPRGVFSDRGEHTFRFRLFAGPTISPVALDQMTFGLQRPPLTADLSRGMKTRALRQMYLPPLA